MHRFFFHRTDNTRDIDTEGTMLENLSEARRQAVRYLGETLTKMPGVIWEGQDVMVEVSDPSGDILFTLVASARGAVD